MSASTASCSRPTSRISRTNGPIHGRSSTGSTPTSRKPTGARSGPATPSNSSSSGPERPSPTRPIGLGPPSPASRRIAGEGAERRGAGEGFFLVASIRQKSLGFGHFGAVSVGARQGDQLAVGFAGFCRIAGLLGRPCDAENAAEAVPLGAHGLFVFLQRRG